MLLFKSEVKVGSFTIAETIQRDEGDRLDRRKPGE